jgi:hypothetical protein
MTIKNVQLGVFAFLATVSMLVASGGTAFAHYMYQTGILYYSNVDCVGGYSEISHGIGYGYTKTYVDARVKGDAGTDCAGPFYRPSGYLSNRSAMMYLLTPGWAFCRDVGKLFNTSSTYRFTVERTHNGFCGHHYYNTFAELYMLNGTWKGGTLWADPYSLWRGHYL